MSNNFWLFRNVALVPADKICPVGTSLSHVTDEGWACIAAGSYNSIWDFLDAANPSEGDRVVSDAYGCPHDANLDYIYEEAE